MLPDPDFNGHTTNFREWRSSEQFNGLKLAYQCCSASVYESAWVIFTVSRACWTWHTQNVETVKSTWDNIAYDLRMSEQWCCDPHLLEIASFIAANNVASWRWLEEMMQNSDGLASKVFNYTVSILGNRVATLSRHSCPPFCYAGIMDAATQQQTLQQMKRDFHLLLSLEVSTAPAADQLASDLRLLFNPLVRLALSLFELNNWSLVQLASDTRGGLSWKQSSADFLIPRWLKIATNASETMLLEMPIQGSLRRILWSLCSRQWSLRGGRSTMWLACRKSGSWRSGHQRRRMVSNSGTSEGTQ